MGKYSKARILKCQTNQTKGPFESQIPTVHRRSVHGSLFKDTFEVLNDIRRHIMKVKIFYGDSKPRKIKRSLKKPRLKSLNMKINHFMKNMVLKTSKTRMKISMMVSQFTVRDQRTAISGDQLVQIGSTFSGPRFLKFSRSWSGPRLTDFGP